MQPFRVLFQFKKDGYLKKNTWLKKTPLNYDSRTDSVDDKVAILLVKNISALNIIAGYL